MATSLMSCCHMNFSKVHPLNSAAWLAHCNILNLISIWMEALPLIVGRCFSVHPTRKAVGLN
ncbi:hypothetical protein CPB83DRAFT_793294 [Crepidotus variabilis]|uniref:Uncharacterized protein n=1 Tax=Crepidotus variabilis TaxID=179855 RepID=A0A9P6EEJ1_9AGAR|nr:hypothetical protein CPB83DRAFT_793294 [Crepidotus variabilis]